jgi:hypothetical protein
MSIQEKVRQIMLSDELGSAEKREQLRALIPTDVFKIDNLNMATPAQLKQLQEALEVAEALQQLNAGVFAMEQERQP